MSNSEMRIAFIGLGIMGRPMAINLIRAGYLVVGYNRHPEPVAAIVAAGGHGATSVAAAVQGAAVIVTMLPDSPDVDMVLAGRNGVFDNAADCSLIIDFSTILPDVSRRLAAQGAARGLRILDAPVSGGEAGAVEGSLSIMVGGAAADFADAAGVFDALGTTIVHVGPSGAGQTVKAANQLIVGGNLEMLAEAIVFLEAHGVDTAAAITVLGGGLAGSAVLQRKAANMLDRNFTPGFRIALHHKDMGIVIDAARAAGVAIPLGAHVAQLIGAANAQGRGALDHSALYSAVREQSGRA
jgi:2-hydroxy-3-oxopropionate reductase